MLLGSSVDKGASANFNSVYFGSHYPYLLSHPLCTKILDELISYSSKYQTTNTFNAEDELVSRFGPTAAMHIVKPILEKLWDTDIKLLAKGSLHCFFDLRRLVIAEKFQADELKSSPSLDRVIANPDQENPKGQVYGGRMGLLFKKGCKNISESFNQWAISSGVNIKYDVDVRISNCGDLFAGNMSLKDHYDACILALPIHLLANTYCLEATASDKSELSLYYFQLDNSLYNSLPSYYILSHDPKYSSSRIVNYDAYRPHEDRKSQSVLQLNLYISLEQANSQDIAEEVCSILPEAKIKDAYKVPRALSLYSPTIKNSQILDKFESDIALRFKKPIYFTGMRTDSGIFFSHHTIGLSHESALECIRQFS